VEDPAVFTRVRFPGFGVQVVVAEDVTEVSPVSDAVAVLLSVVQAAALDGTLVLTVTVAEAPGASVEGEQVSVLDEIEQPAPVL
jgi:hypothetical protein